VISDDVNRGKGDTSTGASPYSGRVGGFVRMMSPIYSERVVASAESHLLSYRHSDGCEVAQLDNRVSRHVNYIASGFVTNEFMDVADATTHQLCGMATCTIG
jgi:hypothetical protein